MKYSVLKNNNYQLGRYSAVPLREMDIFLIKKWRNEQIQVLRQNKILTDQDQLSYYKNHIIPSFSQKRPNIILFSYLYDNNCIGYGGLTNIKWQSKRAELSFLLDTKRCLYSKQYKIDFTNFISLIKKVTFNDLKFNRIFTETFAFRQAHIAILEENGFRLEGKMKQHVVINGEFVDSILHGLLKEYQNA